MQRRSDLECDKIILVIVRSRPFQTVGYLALVEVTRGLRYAGASPGDTAAGPTHTTNLVSGPIYCTYITIVVSVTLARRRQHVRTTEVRTSPLVLSSNKARYALVTNDDHESRGRVVRARART